MDHQSQFTGSLAAERANRRGHLTPAGWDEILRLRDVEKCTYDQIVARCGVSVHTVWKICTGRQSRPGERRRGRPRNSAMRTQFRLHVLPDGNATGDRFRCGPLACTLTVAACGERYRRVRQAEDSAIVCIRCETGRANAEACK